MIFNSLFTALKSNFYCKWWQTLTFQIPWEVNTKSTNFHPGGVISCICYRLVAPERLRFFSESPYDFDHYSLKSSRIFKTATRAYKRIQNSIFSSRIASPFKKRNVTPPPTIPRTAPPGVHSRPILISRLLRMRINEIKTNIWNWGKIVRVFMESSEHKSTTTFPPNYKRMLIFGKWAFFVLLFWNILSNAIIAQI